MRLAVRSRRDDAICQILDRPVKSGTGPHDRWWTFELPDGRGMRRALEFMVPFIKDKTQSTHPRDVPDHDEWPMRHASLLFGGVVLDRPAYLALWKTLEPDSTVEAVVRNFFIRQPLL